MLVLSRKAGETIVVGNVTFTVVRVTANRVRIGIEAPREIVVSRDDCKKSGKDKNGRPAA